MMNKWRIAGIGYNGHRVLLDRRVSRVRAEELAQMLNDAGAFRSVEIEPDDEPITVASWFRDVLYGQVAAKSAAN